MHTSSRTQIYLPEELRAEIDKQRAVKGESLAEYLRKAAGAQVKKDKIKKANLNKFAHEVVGSVKKGAWSRVDVVTWHRKLRRDEDRHLEDKLG